MDSKRIFRDMRSTGEAMGRSKHTLDSYESALRYFGGYFWKKEHPKHVSKKEVIESIGWVRQFHGDSMARTYYWAVRFLFVKVEGQPNKFDGIKPIKIHSKPRVPLSVDFIIGKIKDIQNQRDKAILWLLFGTGMRREEVATLKQDNLLWTSGVISVTGKGNKTRLVPFPENVQQVIKAYMVTQKPSEYVFAGEKAGHWISPDTIYKKVKEYLGASTHVTRHSWATAMKRAGVDILTISRLLGHASVVTTQIYLHDDPEDIRALPNPVDGVKAA